MTVYRRVCSALLVALSVYSVPAFAYLDPGTGSMLLAAFVSLFATILYSVKGFYYKLSALIVSVFHRDAEVLGSNKKDIVIYSEGAQYWHTFAPVIQPLLEAGRSVTYWSSDEKDPGLQLILTGLDSAFIGLGDKAYMRLNVLEANICLLTTPGLDVFQIRKSKGVKHYSHLVHAPTTGTYKLFSFDYFDSVLCSGRHQINAIRELERKRGLPEKILKEAGCVYMDVLAQELVNRGGVEQNYPVISKKIILLAPSWGANGLLKKYGVDLVSLLVGAGFHVIIRPHPQSSIVERALIESIRSALVGVESVEWDFSASNFDSLNRADVLVSDFSGIVFDFAFVFEKPVVTLSFEVDLLGLDANDLDAGLWELSVLQDIGAYVDEKNMSELPHVIHALLEGNNAKEALIELRQKSVFNFAGAGSVAARQICSLEVG